MEKLMNMEQFNEYLRHVKPRRRKIAENWGIAIGLQAVDDLHVSEFLLDVAKRNIDGEITIDEAEALIEEHYREADKDK